MMDRSIEFEVVDIFYYLWDIISAGSEVDLACRPRVKCALNVFRELYQILTKRGISMKLSKGFIRLVCTVS